MHNGEPSTPDLPRLFTGTLPYAVRTFLPSYSKSDDPVGSKYKDTTR